MTFPFSVYPLVNIQKTMENHNFLMGKLTISMAIFHSYFDITRGYQLLISPRLDTDSRQDAPVPNPKSRELAAAIWAGTRSKVPQKMSH